MVILLEMVHKVDLVKVYLSSKPFADVFRRRSETLSVLLRSPAYVHPSLWILRPMASITTAIPYAYI